VQLPNVGMVGAKPQVAATGTQSRTFPAIVETLKKMKAPENILKNFIDITPLPGPLGKLKKLKKFEDGGRVSYKSGSYLYDLFKDKAKYLKTPSGKRDIAYFGGLDALDAIYQLFGLPGLYAGGGIAKQAGVDSGPPPISGPTPDGDEGLPAAFKSVKKTQEY